MFKGADKGLFLRKIRDRDLADHVSLCVQDHDQGLGIGVGSHVDVESAGPESGDGKEQLIDHHQVCNPDLLGVCAAQEFSGFIEDLNAVVAVVGHGQPGIGGDKGAGGAGELAWPLAFLPDDADELAIKIEGDDPMVPQVYDIDQGLRGIDLDVGRPMEILLLRLSEIGKGPYGFTRVGGCRIGGGKQWEHPYKQHTQQYSPTFLKHVTSLFLSGLESQDRPEERLCRGAAAGTDSCRY